MLRTRTLTGALVFQLIVSVFCSYGIDVRTDTREIVVEEESRVERECTAGVPWPGSRLCWFQKVGSEEMKLLCVVGSTDAAGTLATPLAARLAAADNGTTVHCAVQALRSGVFTTVARSIDIPIRITSRQTAAPRVTISSQRLAGAPGDEVPVNCVIENPTPGSQVEFRLTTAEGTEVLSSQTADYPLNAQLVRVPAVGAAAAATVTCVAVRPPETPAQGRAAQYAASEPAHFHLVNEPTNTVVNTQAQDNFVAEMNLEKDLDDVIMPGCYTRGGNLPEGRRLCLYKEDKGRDVKVECTYLYSELSGSRLLAPEDENARYFCAAQEWRASADLYVTVHKSNVKTISVRKPHVSSAAKVSISPSGVVYASPGDDVVLTCAGENLIPQGLVQLYFQRLDVSPSEPLRFVHNKDLLRSELELTVGAADDGLTVACGARLNTRRLAGGMTYARSKPVIIRLLEETPEGLPLLRISQQWAVGRGVPDPIDSISKVEITCEAENPPSDSYLSWFQIYPDSARRHLLMTVRSAPEPVLTLQMQPREEDRGSRLVCALSRDGPLAEPLLLSDEIDVHVRT